MLAFDAAQLTPPEKPAAPITRGVDERRRDGSLAQRGPNDRAAKRRLPKWGIALLALLIGVPLVFAVSLAEDNASVANTAQQFCALEIQGSYSNAYALLSPHARQQITDRQFADGSQALHLILCRPAQTGLALNSLGNSTTILMRFTTVGASGRRSDSHGTMRLMRAGSGWKVDALTSSLFTLIAL